MNTGPITIPIGGVASADQLREVTRDRRLLVLFFDLSSLQPQDLIRTTTAAKRFVREQMTAADLVGVVIFGTQLRVVTDFTNDRDLLDRAIDAVIPGKEAQLASLADATATGNDSVSTQDTGAAFSADETEFNVFNTDRKLAGLQWLPMCSATFPEENRSSNSPAASPRRAKKIARNCARPPTRPIAPIVSIYSVDSRGLMAEIPGGDAAVGAATGNVVVLPALRCFSQTDATARIRATRFPHLPRTREAAVFRRGRLRAGFSQRAGG